MLQFDNQTLAKGKNKNESVTKIVTCVSDKNRTNVSSDLQNKKGLGENGFKKTNTYIGKEYIRYNRFPQPLRRILEHNSISRP
jgi:hypothetical protein